jgi:alanine racemase
VTGPAGRTPIERRLAAAGLPPLPRTAWLELDLDALVANLAVIRDLGGGVPVHPVVKADAYGHGAVPVARALGSAGADGFCVAVFDEALELRAAGIADPVVVLYPTPADRVREAARRRIGLSVGDHLLLHGLLRAAAAAAGRGRPALRLQLEVETGLGRGGFAVDDVAPVARHLVATTGVRIDGLWTHLQAPDDPARTAIQIERFEAAGRSLAAAGIRLPRRHVAASGALFGAPLAAYDGSRPGLTMYGIVPDELVASGVDARVRERLRPVMALHARPVRVVELPAGWGISYGPTFTTARPSRIATLPLGYGDGWPRVSSNRGHALVRGHRAPLVGTVAMDALMVDVTDVPGPPVTPEDEFTLLGRQGDERIDAIDLARLRTTISWEVTTTMAHRLPRVYDSVSGPTAVRTLMGLTSR